MKYHKLTKEEKQIEQDILNGKYVSVKNLKKEVEKLEKGFQAKLKGKTVNFRISESELETFKSKSSKVGMPYQSLLSLLISQYNRNKFTIEI